MITINYFKVEQLFQYIPHVQKIFINETIGKRYKL